ncbi:hypothetical protein BDP27DRAFT_1440302 [Rhodocollybia butyracea]|uniref:F-box domain-containing protein n=1 Tax=Rhodocollybia butyracea TaxID=206335 RepID=A0A9P5P0P5_9AGAR|nr:hypothetical protein BDP27DRAFT_1440302 [Rhodocollybia butyracea]
MFDSPLQTLEIVEVIIDFLADDLSGLCACSLVSRDWTSRARYHLFHCLVLEHSQTELGMIENIHSLIPIIQSPLNTMLSVLDELSLTMPENIMVIEPIMQAASNHSSIAKLSIYLAISPWESLNVLWIPPLFPCLTELTVSTTQNCDDNLLRFIMAFPMLKTLRLGVIGLGPNTEIALPSDLPTTNLSYLRTLHLTLPASESFLLWMAGTMTNLSVLDVVIFQPWLGHLHCANLNAFLRANSKTLEHLCLRIQNDTQSSENILLQETPDLSALETLQCLEIYDQDMLAVCKILETLNASARLDTVIITMSDNPYVLNSIKFWLDSCHALFSVLSRSNLNTAKKDLHISNDGLYSFEDLPLFEKAFEGSSIKLTTDYPVQWQEAADWRAYSEKKRGVLAERSINKSGRRGRCCLGCMPPDSFGT